MKAIFKPGFIPGRLFCRIFSLGWSSDPCCPCSLISVGSQYSAGLAALQSPQKLLEMQILGPLLWSLIHEEIDPWNPHFLASFLNGWDEKEIYFIINPLVLLNFFSSSFSLYLHSSSMKGRIFVSFSCCYFSINNI